MAILIYLIIHYSNTYFSFFFFFQFLIRKVRNCENFCFSNYYILHANISIFLLDILKPNFLQIFAFENSRHFESLYFDRIPLPTHWSSNWIENALIFACRFGARINGHVGYVSRNAEVSRTAASETHIKAVDKRKGALIVRRSSIHEVAGYGYTYVLRCAYTDPCVHVPTHAMRLLTCARVVYVCYHQHGRKRVLPCVVTAHVHVHTMEWFRGRENSPDLPQVPARMSR